jgi:hypothetical protein
MSKNPKQRKLDKENGINNLQEKPYSFESKYPVFCFRHLHKDYHIDQCNEKEKKQFMDQIIQISSTSWEKIQLAPKHGIGSEKINIKAIKSTIPTTFTIDVEHLLAFRFDGMKSFVGYRERFIFHIFFIDRDFTLYSH